MGAFHLFELVKVIQATGVSAQVMTIVVNSASAFGISGIFVSLLSRQRPGALPTILHSGIPQHYIDGYAAVRPDKYSLAVRRMRQTANPFFSRELHNDPTHDPLAHRCFVHARESGLDEWFCVPVHGHEGLAGWVTMTGEKLNLSLEDQQNLQMLSLSALTRLAELNEAQPEAPLNRLSRREHEVLKWVAAGKTDMQIANILSVSDRTIEYHVANAARKFNASNRTQLVATALQAGEIVL